MRVAVIGQTPPNDGPEHRSVGRLTRRLFPHWQFDRRWLPRSQKRCRVAGPERARPAAPGRGRLDPAPGTRRPGRERM